MTAIVGAVNHDGSAAIGCDSFVLHGWVASGTKSPKIVRAGGLLMGTAGDLRTRNILSLVQPPGRNGGDPAQWVTAKLVPKLQAEFAKHGFQRKKEEVLTFEGRILVLLCGRFFCVGGDYSVHEGTDGYAAIGAGQEVALGALAAFAGTRRSAESKIRSALAAAAHHTPYVRPPFHVMTAEAS